MSKTKYTDWAIKKKAEIDVTTTELAEAKEALQIIMQEESNEEVTTDE